jgi:hypothetical protein
MSDSTPATRSSRSVLVAAVDSVTAVMLAAILFGASMGAKPTGDISKASGGARLTGVGNGGIGNATVLFA